MRGIVPVMGMTAIGLMRFALRAAGHRKIGRERHRAAVPAIDLRMAPTITDVSST